MPQVRSLSALSLAILMSSAFTFPTVSTAFSTGPFLSWSQGRVQAAEATALRVVILPFQNLTEKQEDAWLSNSFAESLTMGLLKVRSLQVIERAQVAGVLKEQHFSQSAYVDADTAPRLGKLLGAKVVVMGSYQKVGGQLQANVRFVNAETGQIDTQRFARIQGRFDQLFELQNQLAEELIQQLNVNARPQELQQLRKLIKSTDSTEAYRYYLEGRDIARQGSVLQQEDAIKAYRKALIEDPHYALAYAGLSEIYAHQATYREEMKVLPPDNQRGPSLRELARQNGEKALALNPELPEVMRALARLDWLENREEEAFEKIRRAIALNPRDVDSVILYTGFQMEKEGLFRSDVETLKRELAALGADLDNPWLKFQLVSLGLGQEAVKQAEFRDFGWIKKLAKEVQQALPEHPDVPVVLLTIAGIEGNQSEVQYYYDLAYEKAQGFPLKLAALSSSALGMNRPDEALKLIEQARALAPDDFNVQLMRANIVYTLGVLKKSDPLLQEAEQIYQRLEKQSLNNAYIPFLRGINYMISQDTEKAKSQLKLAIRRMDEQGVGALGLSFAQFSLASIYSEEKNYAEAARLFEVLRSDPVFYGQAYEMLALIYASQDKTQEALDAYTAYLTAHPELQTLPAKKLEYSRYYLEHQLSQNPDDVKILIQLAQTHTELKNFELALTLFEQASLLAPNMPEVYSGWGYLLLEGKDWRKARSMFLRATQLQDDNPKHWYNLGLCYAHLGQREQARQAFEKTLALEPRHSNARAQLELLN